MMKQEFEQLIGKEVSYETFRIYEEMYLAAPESVTKQVFVQMLNIDAIPESEEAIERKEREAERIQQIKRDIAELKEMIRDTKEYLERYKSWSKDDEYWKSSVRIKRQQLERLQARVRELRWLIAQ